MKFKPSPATRSQKIFISPNLKKVIEDTDLIIVASPSFNFRKTLLKLKKCRGQTSANYPPLLGIAKGIEKETLKLPSQIVEEVLGKVPYAHLSGPGFAREIIRGKPAKEVIASRNKSLLKRLKELFKIKSPKPAGPKKVSFLAPITLPIFIISSKPS